MNIHLKFKGCFISDVYSFPGVMAYSFTPHKNETGTNTGNWTGTIGNNAS